jgi:hypothetical protein
VYTVLLVIALLAILLGIAYLYFELDMYQFKHKGGPPVTLRRAETTLAMAPVPRAAGHWLPTPDARPLTPTPSTDAPTPATLL